MRWGFRMGRLWLGVIICLTTSTSSSSSSAAAIAPGVQSHFGDVTYAGGMAYDPTNDVLYVTGQVGPNGCFVGVLKVAVGQWISKHVLPEPAVGVTLGIRQRNEALLLATTREGGLLTDTRIPGSDKSTQYGLLVPLPFSADGQTSTFRGGVLFHEDVVQYPRALVQDPLHSNYIYVASMHSADPTPQEQAQTNTNWTPGGVFQYGSAYTLTVERLRYDETSNNWQPSWRKPFGVLETGASRLSVQVATMIWNKGALVVVGSTQGSGAAFGEASNHNQNNQNGFVTKLDPNTGQFWQQGGETASAVRRIQLVEGEDTVLESICSSGAEADVLYITGMTTNSTTTTTLPFLAQLNAITLEVTWQHIYADATSSARGLACGVGPNEVYMAGIVNDGGTIDPSTTSFGQADVFVAKLDTQGGETVWMKQVGTAGNDRLAHGSTGLLVLPIGGIVLLGDTSGSLLATVTHDSELFILYIDPQGNIPPTTQISKEEHTGGDVPVRTPLSVGNDAQDDGSTPESSDGPKDNPSVIPSTTNDGSNHKFLVVGGIVVLAVVLCLGYQRLETRTEKVTERALVFSYLQEFDLEDVDVRHSATGGWHGTYVGKLAQGSDTNGGGEELYSPSSIVTDSLFVDYDSTSRTTLSSSRSSTTRTNPSEDNIVYDNERDNDDDHDDDSWGDANDISLGPMSYEDQRTNLRDNPRPWGTDII